MKKFFYIFAFSALFVSAVVPAFSFQLVDTANYSVVATIKPSDIPEWPDSVAAWRVYGPYDLDNNGKKEILVMVDPETASANGDTAETRVLRFEVTGDNQFNLVWSAVVPSPNPGEFDWPCLAVSDLDHDGNQEIIVGTPRGSSSDPSAEYVFIYEYDPDLKNFPTSPTMSSKLGFPEGFEYQITSIVPMDIDNDGDIELICSARHAYGGGMLNSAMRPLYIFRLLGDIGDPFSSFDVEYTDTTSLAVNGGYYFNNHVLDYDGNGKMDIFAFTWDMLSFAVYECTGPDSYELKANIDQVEAPDDYGEQNSVGFFDANHDGKPEMFLAGQVSPPSAVFYLPNISPVDSIKASDVKRITPVLGGANFQGAEVGDPDNDGNVDMFIGDWNKPIIYHLEHIDGMTFEDSSGYTFDTLYYIPDDSNSLRNVNIMSDLDGDGKNEIIIVNSELWASRPNDAGLIILESKVATTGVKTIAGQSPATFTLSQNYPNPFNPTSTIRFSIDRSAEVHLYITNALGQRVATLLDRKMDQGVHEVTFNASGLASGAYFYTLKSGNNIQTKKMILMK